MSGSRREIFYLATGGITHMMRLLGNCLWAAAEYDRVVVPVTRSSQSFRVPFHGVFDSRTDRLADGELTEERIRNFVPPASDLPKSLDGYHPSWVAPDNYVLRGYESLGSDWLDIVDSEQWTHPEIGWVSAGSIKSGSTIGDVEGLDPVLSIRRALGACRVVPPIQAKCTQWRNEIPSEFVGVHYRNSDMRHDIQPIIDEADELCRSLGLSSLFWASDDPQSLRVAAAALPHLNVIQLSTPADLSDTPGRGLHYADESQLVRSGLSKQMQLEQTLADIYTLTEASAFVSSPSSGMSHLVRMFREDELLRADFFGL